MLRRRKRIERTLAAKHVADGSLVLCDLTSVCFEGSKCPLAKRGYSRRSRRRGLAGGDAAAPTTRTLVSGGDLQQSLFNERDLAEIASPELHPGERLIVCRNPLSAAERARNREALLAATEDKLDKVNAAISELLPLPFGPTNSCRPPSGTSTWPKQRKFRA